MAYFSIYDQMDDLDIPKLSALAGKAELPKNKRYTVNCNGVEINVQLYFSNAGEKAPQNPYDAYAAIESLYARELPKEEIFWETGGEPQYGDPRFNKNQLIPLTWGQVDRRNRFVIAVANLINNQQTIDAIVQAAAKNKNGTLKKNKVLKIASSGMCYFYEQVFAMVAVAKKEDALSITMAPVDCKIGDNMLWAKDFISTYHPGLPVSEALSKICILNP